MKSNAYSAMLYRDGKLFLASLWRAVLLCVIFGLLLSALLYGILSSVSRDTKAPIAVALVDEDGSLMSNLTLSFIRNQKDVSAVAEIVKTDRETALAGVESGDFKGAVILPKDYLNAITAGNFVHGKVLLSNGALVDASLIRRVARTSENLIRMGQYGVFAGASVVSRHPEARQVYDAYLLKINDTLLYEASTANDRYITEEITAYASSALPLTEHMALLMLLSLVTLSTLFFYRSQTEDMAPTHQARLRALGVGPMAFLLPKILYAFLFRILLCGALLPLLSRFLVLQLSPVSLLLLLAALLSGAILDTLLSVSLAGHRFGIALLSLFFLIQMFFTGGILPLHYLAEPLRAVGRVLPLGLTFSLSAPLLGAKLAPLSLLGSVLWLIPLSFAAARRLRKACTEGGRSQ